ncbi:MULTISPECIES: hypothetical protein [Shouchella]|nr:MULTISPECIES: hypothetical protein [Shouchella]
MKKVSVKECKTCIWLKRVNEQKATCPFAGCLKGVGKAGRP